MLEPILRLKRQALPVLPLLALAFLAPSAHGQDLESAHFDRLMPEISGVQSYPVIHGLIQDRRGFIWIAGPNILSRYDGNSFYFFHGEGDPGFQSDDRLFNIFEDSRGDIWVTSNNGLYFLKKETGRFIRFRHDPSDPQSLSSDRTRGICEDKTGALWIGTMGGGVNRMDPATRRFTRFLHDPSNSRSPGGNNTLSLCSAKDGKIWMGAIGAGLDCHDPETGSWSHYPYKEGEPDGIGDMRYLALREGRDGRILFGTSRSGLFWLEPAEGKFSRISLGEGGAQWRDYRVYSLHEDRDGILWIGTENAGLFRLDPETGALGRMTAGPDQASGDEGGLSHNQIMCILEDREGLLWFGTANGISILNKKRIRFPADGLGRGPKDGLAAGEVLSLYEDRSGVVWVGTEKGGLKTWEGKTGSWTSASLGPELSGQKIKVRVQAIAEDDRGDLWFGTSAGLYGYSRRTGAYVRYLDPTRDASMLKYSGITVLRRGRPGFLWVASMEGGFFEWDIEARQARLYPDIMDGRFSEARINALLVDRRGEVWSGTQWRGVVRFDPGTLRWSEYAYRADDPGSLAHNTIYAIVEDESGRIWAGTEGGPCLYDAKKDNWIRLADDLGLPDRPVYAIVPDGSGDLWMSSLENLIKVQGESRLRRIYGPEDGLRSGRFSFGVGIRCRNGEIVFGGSRGLDGFQPHEIRDNPFLPPVAVTSIDLSYPPRTIPILLETDELTVPLSRLPLVVHVSALSFSHPQRQHFRACMASPEERVFELGTGRDLRLDKLKPRRNRFVFYASNHDGVWNPDGLALTVRVTVPFWKSWIWQLVLAILVAVSFWLWLRRRRRILKQQLLHEIEEDLGPFSERFDLTKREQVIVALILQGKSNKDIGAELFISGKTVKNHLYNIYQKLGVKSRLELANVVREFSAKNRPPAGLE